MKKLKSEFKVHVLNWLSREPQKDNVQTLGLSARKLSIKIGKKKYAVTRTILTLHNGETYTDGLKENLVRLGNIVHNHAFLKRLKPLYLKEGWKLGDNLNNPDMILIQKGIFWMDISSVLDIGTNAQAMEWRVGGKTSLGNFITSFSSDQKVGFNKALKIIEDYKVRRTLSENTIAGLTKVILKDQLLKDSIELKNSGIQLNLESGQHCRVLVDNSGAIKIYFNDTCSLHPHELILLERLFQMLREYKSETVLVSAAKTRPIETIEEAGVKLI